MNNSVQWLNQHPYFVASVVLMLIAIAMLLVLPRHRKTLFVAGLLSTPFGLTSFLHVPTYWEPNFTVHWITSPEDLIWCFAAGVTAWFLACLPFVRRLECRATIRQIVTRSLKAYAFAAILLLTAVLSMPAERYAVHFCIGTMWVMAIALLVVRPDAWPLSIAGSINYTTYHFADNYLFVHLWPETRAYWKPEAQFSFNVLNVPGAELVWAAAFGSLWPLCVAWICDVRWSGATVEPGTADK